mgnify:CR=1 FL=1
MWCKHAGSMSLIVDARRYSNLSLRKLGSAFLLLLPLAVNAQSLLPQPLPDSVVARRGGVDLELNDIDVRIRTMPAELRAEYLATSDRASRLIDSMLLNKQLAEQARKLGIDKEPGFLEELELAKTELLSRTIVERHSESAPIPSVEALAYERYLADPEAVRPDARIDVSHVFVATDGVDEEEAKDLATAALGRAKAGETFAEIEKSLGDGRLKVESMTNIDLSRLDSKFAIAVGTLDKVGDLAGPVRSKFGYHIIRLDHFVRPETPQFASVREQLVETLAGQAKDKVRKDFLAGFSQLETKLNDANISLLRSRYLPSNGSVLVPAAAQ